MPTDLQPDWDRYRGNHHNTVPDPGIIRGGMVSFAAHVGKPLSPRLWEDLIFRLRGFRLRVYRDTDERWTDAWTNCDVTVDENDVVLDIRYAPPFPWRPDTVHSEIGQVVMNEEALKRVDFR